MVFMGPDPRCVMDAGAADNLKTAETAYLAASRGPLFRH